MNCYGVLQDIQDDMADMLEQADEVQDAMGRTYGMPEVDDDDLQAELDALGDEMALDDDSSYLDDVVKAPEAPDREPGADSIQPGKVLKDNHCIVIEHNNIFHFFRAPLKRMSSDCPKYQPLWRPHKCYFPSY